MHTLIAPFYRGTGCAFWPIYEKSSYHLQPEYGYTELSPIKNTGTYNKVISTGFWNLALPLIRYNIGDSIVPSDKSCLCGRSFPLTIIKHFSDWYSCICQVNYAWCFGQQI